MVNKNAGLILEEKDLNKENLIKMIDDTLNDKEKYENIKKNLHELAIFDSSTRIYNILKDLIINDKRFF